MSLLGNLGGDYLTGGISGGAQFGSKNIGGLGDYLGYGQAGINADNVLLNNPGYQNLNQEALNGNDPSIMAALNAAAQSGNGDSLLGSSAAQARQAVLDPATASLFASSQVANNPLFANALGKGGLSDQLALEDKNLASQGWSLQPQDYSAYGQASDNIARQFGQTENGLMAGLASRGMAQGDNGVAGVAFSGLQGNKNEALRSAQTQIANDRMNMNLNRLNAVRGQQISLQQEAQNALGQQEGNNLNSVSAYNQNNINSLNAGQMNQNQINAQFAQQQGTKTPTFGQLLGAAGAQSMGNLLGGGVTGGKGLSSTSSTTGTGAGASGSMADNGYGGMGGNSSNTYAGGAGDNSGDPSGQMAKLAMFA